jgi:3-oxoacyl-[acyl-carrier-protein] synthase-3
MAMNREGKCVATAEMQVKLFRRFHGLREISLDPQLSLEGLLLRAAAGLSMLRGREDRVRYVLYARMMPSSCRTRSPAASGVPHAGAAECARLRGHAAVLRERLLAIDLADRLLAVDAADGQDPAAEPLALVLAGEKAF